MKSCPIEWERTENAIGHRPKFEVKCFHCGTKMVVRNTKLLLDAEKIQLPANIMRYKCPNCAWLVDFEVTDTPQYLRRVARFRHGATFLVPDTEVWASEDEKIARQLEGLGYFGGK